MSYSNIIGGGQLRSDAAAAWNRLEEAYRAKFGSYLTVRSALRTFAEQTRLYNGWIKRLPGFSLAAKPGTSLHEKGLSVDVAAPANVDGSAQHEWLEANAPAFGFKWTGRDFSPREAWHFDFVGGGSASTPAISQEVANQQAYLNATFNAGLVVDGIRGPKTKAAIAAYQRVLGIIADGEWGPDTQAHHQAYYDAHHRPQIAVDGSWGDATWRRLQADLGVTVDGNPGPLTIQALQARIGAVPDGQWGPASKRALQARLGVAQDGAIGPQTVRALQARLNAGSL